MAQAATVTKGPEFVIERANPRRFELPDLDRHGGWLVERLARAFFKTAQSENALPAGQTNSSQLASFLKGVVYSNEFHFLYLDHAVGLAQIDPGGSLSALPVVRERFVFVQNPEDKDQLDHAADFYQHFARWGRFQGAAAMIVEEMSDVPHDLIRERLGLRLFNKNQVFARLSDKG